MGNIGLQVTSSIVYITARTKCHRHHGFYYQTHPNEIVLGWEGFPPGHIPLGVYCGALLVQGLPKPGGFLVFLEKNDINYIKILENQNGKTE